MRRTRAILTEDQVVEILGLLQGQMQLSEIAERYHVSVKCISRIVSGEAWQSVSLRHGMHLERHNVPLQIPSLSEEFCDLHNATVAVKQHFGFRMEQPIHWGWFESWDGLHAVTSDGYIIWESKDLVAFAKRLAESKINTYPILSDKAEELPTFELEDIMGQPTGDVLNVTNSLGDMVKLSNTKRELCIRAKYATIATKLKLDFREVQGKPFVYLTKNKPKAKNDPLPIVIACITTIERQLS
jgi:hypothetical protein